MESQYQKWVTVSYLAVAALLYYIVFTVGLKLSGAWDLEARVRDADLIVRGISVLAGVITFVVLYRHDQANQFMNEVMVELSRVTWPTGKETYSATIVVIVMVVLSGIILGALDQFWTMLMKWIL